MAMEEILDSVRRIVHKWVNTTSLVMSNVSKGDVRICVKNASRFSRGDSVMIKKGIYFETGLVVEEIEEQTGIITLTTPVLNDWITGNPSEFVNEDVFLIKTIYEQFVQAIYIGEPDVIPMFPAITVNGISRHSEWLTLESTKERYEIEVTVFVKASTHEDGYRFLLNITDEIQAGLKKNIFPLVSDYDIISLAENISSGDTVIRVNNRDDIGSNRRVIIEDDYETQENWIIKIYSSSEDSAGNAIKLKDQMCFNFDTSNTSVVIPRRFVFNSWPADIEYGTIHKGELLKAAKIRWFAEEEEGQFFRREELKLK